MPLTKNVTLDAFLTRYFEETKKPMAEYIDLPLYKQIAFKSGAPKLLVDIFGHLSAQPEKVEEAMLLLCERVDAKHIPRQESPTLEKKLD